MSYRILVLGGYGNFGKRISAALAKDPNIHVLIGGRNLDKASALANKLHADSSAASAEGFAIDIYSSDLVQRLRDSGAQCVIHTCGPFQGQGYTVAQACIDAEINYLDLADDRCFVVGIDRLSEAAKKNNVLIVSGASSVPGLSSAVVEQRLPSFSQIHSIRHSIAPGNRAERGVATIKAILSYTGRPFKRWEHGQWQTVYGWQDIHRHRYPGSVGSRWLASCDIPDLELFPKRYAVTNEVVFHAGLELSILHLGMYAMSWLSRARIIDNWSRYAEPITNMSIWFESFGTDIGSMVVEVKGLDKDQKPLTMTWKLIAEDGDGPQIPTISSIILAKKLASGHRPESGAIPCLGLFSVDEFMAEVKDWKIRQWTETS